MISYECNKCGADMESPDGMIGKMETCPVCNRRMKVKDPAVIAEEAILREQAMANAPMDDFFCSVAGVTKEGRQRIVKTCKENEPAFLRREPDNPYGDNAIAVYVERKGLFGRTKHEQVGYVPSDDAPEIAYWMDKGHAALARIRYVVGGDNGKPFGLRIEVEIQR